MRKSAPGFAVWFTGLPASGKTTLARALGARLREEGIASQLLDSDALRKVLTPQPTYTAAERDWFYGVLVFLAGLLADNGVNVIIAATGPRRAYREAARARLPRFAEVFVDCPLEVCQARDPKGLWQKAEAGEITGLPGAGAPYEAPLAAEVRVDTGKLPVAAAVEVVREGLRQMAFLGEG